MNIIKKETTNLSLFIPLEYKTGLLSRRTPTALIYSIKRGDELRVRGFESYQIGLEKSDDVIVGANKQNGFMLGVDDLKRGDE